MPLLGVEKLKGKYICVCVYMCVCRETKGGLVLLCQYSFDKKLFLLLRIQMAQRLGKVITRTLEDLCKYCMIIFYNSNNEDAENDAKIKNIISI